MERKKWTKQLDDSEQIAKLREKRKWQIALRRYILDKNPSFYYAPFFGLDIENMRKWLECQFIEDIGWNNFGVKWQFGHIVPVTYFNFSDEEELKICWNFSNIRVEIIKDQKNLKSSNEILWAKEFFSTLYKETGFSMCFKMLEKIQILESFQNINNHKQQDFIKSNIAYLNTIQNYTDQEFELLNNGLEVHEIQKHLDFYKKYEAS